jgi:hypothetical protein
MCLKQWLEQQSTALCFSPHVCQVRRTHVHGASMCGHVGAQSREQRDLLQSLAATSLIGSNERHI